MPVFVIILDVPALDEFTGLIDIRFGVCPDHPVDAVDRFYFFLIVLGFIERHVIHHHAGGPGVAEFLFHQVDPGFRRRVFRKILLQIVIDFDEQVAKKAENNEDAENDFKQSPPVDNKIDDVAFGW
jgi:hypothetical protein